MKKISFCFWTMLILVSTLILGSPLRRSEAAKQVSDESALRAVAESFYAAYEKRDLPQMLELWSASAYEFQASRQEYEKQLAEADFRFTPLELSRIKISGADASLRVSLAPTIFQKTTGRSTRSRWVRNMEFVKENLQWKIVREASAIDDLAGALIAAGIKENQEKLLAAEADLAASNAAEIALALRLKTLGVINVHQRLEVLRLAHGLAEKSTDAESRYLMSCTLARAVLKSASTFHQLGNIPRARPLYQESRTLAEKLDFPLIVASGKLGLGLIETDEGNLESGIALLRSSLETFERVSSNAPCQTLLSKPFPSPGNLSQKTGANDLAELLRLGKTSSRYHLGKAFLLQGELSQALNSYEASLTPDISDLDARFRPNALHHIGIAHLMQGDPAKAAIHFEQAIGLFRSNRDRLGIGDVLLSQGVLLANEGRDRKEAYNEAIKKFEELLAAPGDRLQTAKAWNGLGNVHEDRDAPGDKARALEAYQKSEEINRQLGNKSDLAYSQLSLSQAYLNLNRPAEALEHAQQSITLAEATGVRDTLWRAHCVAGLVQRALNQPAQARQELLASIRIIEDLRTKVAGEALNLQQFFENKIDPYQAMVELAADQQNFREALQYAEQTKARTLLEILGGQTKAVAGQELSQAQQRQEKQLKSHLLSASLRVSQERRKNQQAVNPSANLLKQVEAEEETARREYEAFSARLSSKSKTLRGEAPTFSLDDALHLLPDDRQALLEFVIGEEQSFLFVLTRIGAEPHLKLYPLPIQKEELAAKITKTLGLFTPNPGIEFRRPLRDLYETLLRPAQEQLDGKTTLIISPDGPLWEVPFQALMPSETEFLLEKAAISYTPSLTALREFVKAGRKPVTSPSLLAIGNPILGATVNAQLTLPEETLAPLPDAEREVREIRKLYASAHSRSYLGAKADEDTVKNSLSRFNVLHFATHGVFNHRNPLSSFIVLSQANRNEKNDGLLQAREFLSLKLQADLVVLSACKTARGRIGAGEGVIGLSWALFAAGTPATVVSQWKVDAASSADLMIRFHRYLRGKAEQGRLPMSKAEALRLASLKVMKSGNSSNTDAYRNPYFWAGFILVGNGY